MALTTNAIFGREHTSINLSPKIRIMLVASICWIIWREKNNRIFNNMTRYRHAWAIFILMLSLKQGIFHQKYTQEGPKGETDRGHLQHDRRGRTERIERRHFLGGMISYKGRSRRTTEEHHFSFALYFVFLGCSFMMY